MFLGCEPVNSSLSVPPAAHTCHPRLVASLASPLPLRRALCTKQRLVKLSAERAFKRVLQAAARNSKAEEKGSRGRSRDPSVLAVEKRVLPPLKWGHCA